MRPRMMCLSLVFAALIATGCGAPAGPSPGSANAGDITVFAAASLTESFRRIGRDFEAANPGTTVTLSFGGSSGLAQQINEGAPVDVFAAASPATMSRVVETGNAVGTPTTFARNQLVIVVAKGNPEGVTGLAGLAAAGVTVALCAEQVPCGAAAVTVLRTAGVTLTPVTLDQDVKAALTRVRLGEVDAALVYRTDARATPDVTAIEFPESALALNDYPIVVLANSPNPAVARAFIDYVESQHAATVLREAGFQLP